MNINILNPGERFFKEERTATFRKEEFKYIHTGIIDEEGDTWTTTELDEANIFQVYNQYRTKHSIPFPDEIAGLRKHYGLSAAKMSQILGFGINQYRMYEDGEVPGISNARTLMAAREKDVMLKFLEASKSDMSDTEYQRIFKKVSAVEGDYTMDSVPTEMTGYKSLSLDKTAAVISLILTRLGAIFVTKMNKLLFYADFIHYKNHGYGITGLTYRALPHGPVPENWGTLYDQLPNVAMEEYIYPSGHSGIQLKNIIDNDSPDLDECEIQTIDKVCNLFKDVNAGQISTISHKEKAWLDNHERKSQISYQEAFALNFN